MMMRMKSLALLSALALVGVSALAVARDGSTTPGDRSGAFARTPDSCPPAACTIVFKTPKGGPPSTLVAVD